ncbi:hypothetical protein [Candidatus Erwinia haradaeae]|nr:hypothetical protein [Candidatus Erwinia haradaeae]
MKLTLNAERTKQVDNTWLPNNLIVTKMMAINVIFYRNILII